MVVPQKRDEDSCVVEDIVFRIVIVIITIQTRIPRLLAVPLVVLKKKRVPPLEKKKKEDAFTAKSFSGGTKDYRKQREDDQQNHV